MGIFSRLFKKNKQEKVGDKMSTLNVRRYIKRLEENSVWYAGIDTELKRFYLQEGPAQNTTGFRTDEMNYFWSRNNSVSNVRAIHSGVPQLISEKMVDLLVGNGFSIRIKSDDMIEDEETQARLDKILDENNFKHLIQEAIETESWAGGFPFKLSLHKEFDTPVLELVQPEFYEPTIKAGRIVEDNFKIYYDDKDNKERYKLVETYGADDRGAYIKYKLYIADIVLDDVWTEVPLSRLTSTKGLKDIYIPGVKKLSIYKPNKLPNSEFRGSKIGESDYSGSYGAFDAIDEILSTWIQEYRDGKINKFWPENLLPQTDDGKLTVPNAMKKDFIMYNPGISQEAQSQTVPLILQADLNTDKHEAGLKKWLELVLNNAGLSPISIGVTGLESTAASESSQILREKTSIRTRGKKLELWKECLEKFIPVILQLDDYRRNQKIGEYDIVVDFEDYDLKTTMDRTQEAALGISSKTWDMKSAIDYIHSDLTDEEKILMRVNIKIENGMNTFTREEELVYRKYIAEISEDEDEDEPNIDTPDTDEDIEAPEPEEELEDDIITG